MFRIKKLKDLLPRLAVIFLISISLYSPVVDARISPVGIYYDYTPESFENALKSGKPTLLDFSKDTCSICVRMIPIMKEIRKEYADVVNIITVDANEYKELAKDFGVYGVPVFIFFDKNGNEVGRLIGYQEKETLIERLEELIPDITIKKRIEKDSENGTFIVYLEVENNGKRKIENIEIKDKIPNGLDVLINESLPRIKREGNEIIFNLDLYPRNRVELFYKMRTYSPGNILLDATTALYKIDGEVIEVKSNKASISIESIKSEVKNESYEKIEDEFETKRKEAIIVISKSLNKDTVKEGEEVIVTLEIKNIGNDDAKDIRIIDSVCEDVKVVSGETIINLPFLRVGQKETFSYVIKSDKSKKYTIPPANIIFFDENGLHTQESNEVDLNVESRSYSIVKGIILFLLFLFIFIFLNVAKRRK
ncbi:MAG: thioredoxin domain-containing protein [Candidatus Hydrothermarchaeota archaeon]